MLVEFVLVEFVQAEDPLYMIFFPSMFITFNDSKWQLFYTVNDHRQVSCRMSVDSAKDILIIGLLLNNSMLCKPKKDNVSKLKLSGMYMAMYRFTVVI